MGCNCGGRNSGVAQMATGTQSMGAGVPTAWLLYYPAPGPDMPHGGTVRFWDEEQARAAERAIEGSWVVKIDPRNDQPIP